MKTVDKRIEELEQNKADKIEITTGVEFETGRIIDGKKEYGKRINLGTMPNATNTTYSTGISSSYLITKYMFFAKHKSNNQTLIIPFLSLNFNNKATAYMDNASVVSCAADWNMTNYDLYLEICYTKN